jgi:chromate transporter
MIRDRSGLEVLVVFSRLGVSCFGGPIAHLGYFREEFVVRRRWLDDSAYADLVALCQFLPGPASSQVAFALGLLRAGYAGAIAAWLGFTLPSAAVLVAFAYGAGSLGAAGPAGAGLLHGLKLVAVAIVAQAVAGMARSMCPDRQRASIAVVAAVLVLASSTLPAQIGAIALGAAAGYWWCRTSALPVQNPPIAVGGVAGFIALASFTLLLVGLPLLQRLISSPAADLFAAFYRSGALVFGGGHVVLPLLREAVVPPGWVSDDAFLAGYGAAQAVPGPLFSFAAYLGAIARPAPGIPGALIALVGIFLPGMLLLVGVLPVWGRVRANPGAQAIMRGVNAAVVGLLAAALYDPIWSTAVRTRGDFGLALAGFVLLTVWRAPPLVVVVLTAVGGIVLAGV